MKMGSITCSDSGIRSCSSATGSCGTWGFSGASRLQNRCFGARFLISGDGHSDLNGTNSVLFTAPSTADIDELQALYREGVRLAEEEQKMLHEEPHDVLKNLSILQALRAASETEPARNSQAKSRTTKRQKLDTDGANDSPGLSPNVATSASRLKGSSVRSGSVTSVGGGKEASVKVEEGAEGFKGPAAEKAGKFSVGAVVAYRQAKMKEDGSQWIQCNIISITGEGSKKRWVF